MSIFPAVRYDDAPAAIAFLRDTFGFEVVADYRSDSDPDRVEHAELRWPEGGGVMLGSGREDSSIKSLPTGTGAIYVVTERPDELHARAVEAGATITHELQDEDYGSRGFTCRDPEGVHWSFGTYAGAAAG
jgi:uncharacterized glyoxalase superfamily protein PhnB